MKRYRNRSVFCKLATLAMTISLLILTGSSAQSDEPERAYPALTSSPTGKHRAPELTDVAAWINTKAIKMADQKGKVVLVHFWTHSCINCIHNYPYYKEWSKKYQNNKDLIMVGIHTPEFSSEKNILRIKEKVKENDLKFPIAVDNQTANWKAWYNRYWPCVYLVDKNGFVRYRWEGELGEAGYKKMSALLESLLNEKTETNK